MEIVLLDSTFSSLQQIPHASLQTIARLLGTYSHVVQTHSKEASSHDGLLTSHT
jgi:hypothetical protein